MNPSTTQSYNIPSFLAYLESNKLTPKRRVVYSVTKKYPDFSRVYLYHEGKKLQSDTIIKTGNRENITTSEQTLIDSLRRTKTTISDIVLSNKFDMFATFTFNCNGCKYPCSQKTCDISTPHQAEQCTTVKCDCPPDQCLRLDPDICKKRMSQWLDNTQKNHGKFQYIIVPEWHKNGGLHFHAMLKNYTAPLTPAHRHRTKKNYIHKGSQVYNINSYKNGFTTIKLIPNTPTDHAKVSNYIKKYIVKDMPNFKGKKRYFASKDLIYPNTEIGDNITTNPYIHPDDIKTVYETPNMTIKRAEIRNRLRPLKIFRLRKKLIPQIGYAIIPMLLNNQDIICPKQGTYSTQQTSLQW